MDGDGRNLRRLLLRLATRNGFGCWLFVPMLTLLLLLLLLSSMLLEVGMATVVSTRLGSSVGLLEHISSYLLDESLLSMDNNA